MPTEPKSKHIPRATIQRLATYVQVLENFARDGVEVISSNPLAEACGVNGSQVRKDLAYFGEFGIRGVGYHITSLIAAITSSLGVDREWRMALVGVAPELPGAKVFAARLKDFNILPCTGHSDADCNCALKAFGWGFRHVTHLYSCMSSVHRTNGYRHGGIVEAAFLNDFMTVELIADGAHLPPELLKLVYKIKGPEKIALITDSMRGAGMPEGKSVLGCITDGLPVIVEDGVAKLPDRTAFAGSVATCDRLVKTMVQLAEIPLSKAVQMASQTPADILSLAGKGQIKEGFDADIVIFDKDIHIMKTIVGGKVVYG